MTNELDSLYRMKVVYQLHNDDTPHSHIIQIASTGTFMALFQGGQSWEQYQEHILGSDKVKKIVGVVLWLVQADGTLEQMREGE